MVGMPYVSVLYFMRVDNSLIVQSTFNDPA